MKNFFSFLSRSSQKKILCLDGGGVRTIAALVFLKTLESESGKKVSDMFNKKFITPYLRMNVKEYFYSMDWYQLNQPYQKHHVRTAFNLDKDVKKHLNLQLDSKINVLFERLLNNNKINYKGRTRVMDMGRDWPKPTGATLNEFMI